MKVIVQKIDLDTCLTAHILGVQKSDEIVATQGDALFGDLQNSQVICIEAGGSGMTAQNNYDHHQPGQYFPPACQQALNCLPHSDDRLGRLVDYVCMVDEAIEIKPPIPFPSLSSLFSGMLLTEKSQINQFWFGISIFRKVLVDGIDPFGAMPDLPEWRPFIFAKLDNQREVEQVLGTARFFMSGNGLKIGYLEASAIGGIRALYSQGCQVVILFNPAFGEPPARKFTIAGNQVSVDHLMPILEKVEPGWGGHRTIIGSPRKGSYLSIEQVMDVVIYNM